MEITIGRCSADSFRWIGGGLQIKDGPFESNPSSFSRFAGVDAGAVKRWDQIHDIGWVWKSIKNQRVENLKDMVTIQSITTLLTTNLRKLVSPR
jgi:hypothetical protein